MKVLFTWLAAMLFSAAFVFVPKAQASTQKPFLIWCQNCTPMQKHQMLMKKPLGSTVYIGDAIQHTVAAYYIDHEGPADTGGPGGDGTSQYTSPSSKVTVSITPDSYLVNGINAAMDFYNATPVGWHKHITTTINTTTYGSTTYPGSVYDIVDAGPQQNAFMDNVNSIYTNHSSIFMMGFIRQVITGTFNVGGAVMKVHVTLKFSDGSTVEDDYDGDRSDLKLDPSTARDSHGNNIPYIGKDGVKENLGGYHNFDSSTGNPNDLDNFLNQLLMMGVPIGNGSGGAGSGGGGSHGWACVKVGDGANAIYYCEIY